MKDKVILWMPQTEEEWVEASKAVLRYVAPDTLKSSMEYFMNDAITISNGKAEQCMSKWHSDPLWVNTEQFFDVLNNRIVPWRLEAVGYAKEEEDSHVYFNDNYMGGRVCVGFFLDGSIVIHLHVEYSCVPLEIEGFNELMGFMGHLKKL